MSGRTLDLKRSYGTVAGAGPRHAFEQDGLYFDQDGDEVDVAGNKVNAGKPEAASASDKPLFDPALLLSSIPVIAEKLPTMDVEALKALRAAEAAGKARKSLDDAIGAALAAKGAAADEVAGQMQG